MRMVVVWVMNTMYKQAYKSLRAYPNNPEQRNVIMAQTK